MNKKEEYKLWKESGIDLESFNKHGLTLIPVDDKGTLRLAKLNRDDEGRDSSLKS